MFRRSSDADASVAEAVDEIRKGRLVVVVDDEERENEGDLVGSAELISSGLVNFMASQGRGLICVATTPDRLDELDLPPMVDDNTASHGTSFSVSVDLKIDGHTGISASDRAATIRSLCRADTRSEDLARPGHVFPLRAHPGGVLQRAGHTEAAVTLMRLAGMYPAGVLCEILRPDGELARERELRRFAHRHRLRILRIKDLVELEQRSTTVAVRVGDTTLPTDDGRFRVLGFRAKDAECIALIHGDITEAGPILTRIHSVCLTGDVFESRRCDCGDQLRFALRSIRSEGSGIVIYMTEHEGRGIGLLDKLRAYELQDQGLDTVEANEALGFPADARDYRIAAAALAALGVSTVRLMTNNPAKIQALRDRGIAVTERLPIHGRPSPDNIRYLQTKQERLGHAPAALDGPLPTADPREST